MRCQRLPGLVAQGSATAVRSATRLAASSRSRRPPPPPPGVKHRLPPPPPLGHGVLRAALGGKPSAASVATTAAGASSASLSAAGVAIPWKSPHEVLSHFIEYVPTFYVPVPTVAAILSEETRVHFLGRGRFINFFRRYPFFFDLRTLDGGARVDVRLREDVSHPEKGVADAKFMMVDVGEVANYVAKPEFIVSTDSIDQSSQSVNVLPPSAPPAVRVHLEERVPVLERLQALVPAEFTAMDALEDEMPEDILFHPYFDCQGGLSSIASKFPQHFQVVDGMVRLRPPHLAPLALNEYSLKDSPIPSVAAMVAREVCNSSVPHWVSLTALYEQLSREEKREVKKGFKSFAGFLRAHGRSLSVSQDMLQVAMWVAPVKQPTATASSTPPPPEEESSSTRAAVHRDAIASHNANPAGVVRFTYTQTQVINELFDRFPPQRTLSLTDAVALLPREMAAFSLPKRVLGWLAAHPQYFVVEDPTETDPAKARIRRASERQPLDLALAIYAVFPDTRATPTAAKRDTAAATGGGTVVAVNAAGEAEADAVLAALPSKQRAIVDGLGWAALANVLPEWLAVRTAAATAKDEAKAVLLRPLRTIAELEEAIHDEESKRH